MEIIEILKAILFGVVEGITEWLPVSSTGHMILLDELVKLNVSEDFMSMFLVVIQLGAILAVVMLYFPKLWPFSTKEKFFIKKDTFSMWFKILVACVPAAVVGILFEEELDRLFYNYWTVAFALIVFGVLFIVIEHQNKDVQPKVNSIAEITYPMAFCIGAFQLIAAVFPGTSRSGATILGADHDRYIQNRSGRIYLLSGGTGYAGCQSSEDLQIRTGIYVRRDCTASDWYGSSICSIHCGN